MSTANTGATPSDFFRGRVRNPPRPFFFFSRRPVSRLRRDPRSPLRNLRGRYHLGGWVMSAHDMPWGGCGRAAPSMCGCDRAAPRKCLLGADQCVGGPGWELHSRAVAPPASSCSACGPRSRVSARSPPLRVWGHRPSTPAGARLQALTAGRRTCSEPMRKNMTGPPGVHFF